MFKWLSRFKYKVVGVIDNAFYDPKLEMNIHGSIICLQNDFGHRKLKVVGGLWSGDSTTRYHRLALPWKYKIIQTIDWERYV